MTNIERSCMQGRRRRRPRHLPCTAPPRRPAAPPHPHPLPLPAHMDVLNNVHSAPSACTCARDPARLSAVTKKLLPRSAGSTRAPSTTVNEEMPPSTMFFSASLPAGASGSPAGSGGGRCMGRMRAWHAPHAPGRIGPANAPPAKSGTERDGVHSKLLVGCLTCGARIEEAELGAIERRLACSSSRSRQLL